MSIKLKFCTSTGKELDLKEINEIFDEIRKQATKLIKDQLKNKDQDSVAEMFGISKGIVWEVEKGYPITLIMTAIRILTEFDKMNKKKGN
jgi:hypothetical protein